MVRYGAKALNSAELLALLLRTGTKEDSVLDYAKQVLKRFPITTLPQRTVRELQTIPGTGLAKATSIKAAFELARRAEQGMESRTRQVKSSNDVYEEEKEMRFLRQEECRLLLLDTKHHIASKATIARGTLNSAIIHPREVYARAIREHAHAIIIVHNHPSGDPQPSDEDERITAQLKETGKTVGIELLDHVIIGNGTYYSFMESAW